MAANATIPASGNSAPPGAHHPQPVFFRRFVHLAGAFWQSDRRWRARALTAVLVALTFAQVLVPIAINRWSLRLFDALEQRALQTFVVLIGVLVLIIAANALVTTTHLRVKRRLQVEWRSWLTGRVLDEWLSSGRHYHVSFVPGEHDNPDQRIAEDIRIATEYAVDLAHSLFYCILLLASFTQILWTLSGPPRVEFGLFSLYLPGHLVWVALVYASVGSAAAVLLGQPLVRAANRRQRDEANFRFGLVRARENALSIALRRGEGEERRQAGELFAGAVRAWNRQTVALSNLFLFSSSWSVLSQAFPVLVAAPRYMAGVITLGVLMQTAQAFQQMIAALAWPIDNIPKLADWRASVERVLGLHDALRLLGEQFVPRDRPTITLEHSKRPVLAFRQVAIADAAGQELVGCFSAEIAEGERVLISGDRSTAVTLFKVVGGLWPWGHGQVELPENGPIFFMPRRPYMPTGPLRGVLTYPPSGRPVDDAAIQDALRRVGLGNLIARLNEAGEWEQLLVASEKQRIGFARLLLQRPRWIFINEATDALGPQGEAEMIRLLEQEFADATVVTIGHNGTLEAFHRRRLVIVGCEGEALVEETPARPV
jgi:putative ATP-binding cassette transporter